MIDASLALAWVFADEATPETDAVGAQVAAEGAVVPELWRLEVGNVLLVAERRGRIAQGESEAKLADLAAMGIQARHSDEGGAKVIGLARKHGLSS
ncbi:MAG: type II toxin-antitoxin system VapC family toxin, partial [Bifidobacteriaceae bacterium]|nr:type II toxin-antitoxin system VapC family toxin [Bifidobacteriaceae bacterium]